MPWPRYIIELNHGTPFLSANSCNYATLCQRRVTVRVSIAILKKKCLYRSKLIIKIGWNLINEFLGFDDVIWNQFFFRCKHINIIKFLSILKDSVKKFTKFFGENPSFYKLLIEIPFTCPCLEKAFSSRTSNVWTE